MKRLPLENWKNIVRNLEEEGEEVEVLWLDNVGAPGEWVLGFDCELFEDGFTSDIEAEKRLEEIYKLLEAEEEHTNDNMSSRERAMREAGHRETDFQ